MFPERNDLFIIIMNGNGKFVLVFCIIFISNGSQVVKYCVHTVKQSSSRYSSSGGN